MTKDSPSPAELRRLLDNLVEGDVSEAEFLQLEAILSVDAIARQEYLDRTGLEVMLRDEATRSQLVKAASQNATVESRSQIRRLEYWLFAATTLAVAASLILAIGFWLGGNAAKTPDANLLADTTTEAREQSASGFAVIAAQHKAIWQQRDVDRLASGMMLPTGELTLASGVVHLELFSGVTVVVEGPARFAVVSPMQMDVQSGKVRALVPEPAQGFRVSTRAGDIVDLGTEFAVSVTDAECELYVLDGEVDLYKRDGAAAADRSEISTVSIAPQRLIGGEAIRMLPGGEVEMTSAEHVAFLDANQLRQQVASEQSSKLLEWKEWSTQLRSDPRLVAYYQVDEAKGVNRRLENLAAGDDPTLPIASEAAVVAAVPVADRWQRDGNALDFSPMGSRVRLTVPGEFGGLTLVAWVRINSLDRWYNSLFLTDGHEMHEPHWQIMDDGRLFFSVKKRDSWNKKLGQRDKHIFYSPPFWNASLSGQWIMLATTYDVEAMRVTHFLNGSKLSEELIPEEYVVRSIQIGDASICNWGLPEREEPKFAVRNLNGSLDEFMMFRVALSAEEIKEFYNHGRP